MLRIAAESLMVLVLIALDPFGLSAITSVASRQMIDRLHAVFTPATESDRITVVLVDPPTLHRSGETWPPSFAFWHELLDTIVENKPLSVFVDVYFGVDRSGPRRDDLIDMVRRDDPAGARILLADLGDAALTRALLDGTCLDWSPDGGDAATAVRHDVGERCRPSALFPTLRDATGSRRVFIDWQFREDARLYPLHTVHAVPMNNSDDVLTVASPMPATALAREVCREVPGRPAVPAWCKTHARMLSLPAGWTRPQVRPRAELDEAKEKEFNAALLPRWSLYASATSRGFIDRLSPVACALPEYGALLERWWRAVGLLWITSFPSWLDKPGVRTMFGLPSLSGGEPERLDASGKFGRGQACPHIVVVHASDLLRPTDRAAPVIGPAIANRVVLVGAALEGVDQWATPLHGRMPGVFIHAVALETLLRYGPDHPTEPEKWGIFTSGDLLEFVLTVLFLTIVVLLAARRRFILGAVLLTFITFALPYLCFFTGYLFPAFTAVNIPELMIYTTSMALSLSLKALPLHDDI